MNWISVKDRMPEHDEKVLATFKLSKSKESAWYRYPLNVHFLKYHNPTPPYGSYWKDASSLHPVNSEKVTHWMPLPEPPKD